MITDNGDQKQASRLERVSRSYDRSPGPLNEQLYKALKGAPGPSRKFCPNNELLRLIVVNSVVEELERHERALQIQKKTAAKATKKKQKGIQRFSNQAIEAGRSLKLGIRDRVISFEPKLERTMPLARQICGSHRSGLGQPRTYRKIFAILVMIEMPHKIKRFLKERVCDADLPLDSRVVSGKVKLFRRTICPDKRSLSREQIDEGGLLTRLLDRKAGKPLKCFRRWDSNRKGRFYETQWAMTAHIFNQSTPDNNRPVIHHQIQPEVVMPFISWVEIGHGAFSQVYKAEIHKDYHCFKIPEVPILS